MITIAKVKTQSEEFDGKSLDALPEQQEEYEEDLIVEDEVYEDGDGDYLDDDEGDEPKKSLLDSLTEKFGLTPKAMAYTAGGVITVGLAILLFNPFGTVLDNAGEDGGGEAEESSGGFLSKLIAGFSSSESGDDSEFAMIEAPEEVLAFAETHALEYPDYELFYNEMDGTSTFTGLNSDGVYHDLIYDMEFALIGEYVDGNEAFSANGSETGDEAEGTIEVMNPATELVEGEEKIYISEKQFYNSMVSLPPQHVELDADEYGSLNETVETKKLIIQYKKIPLTGRLPMLRAVVAETDEVIIFPVSLTQYAQIPEKGSTIIEVEVTVGHGAIGYSNIKLVDWQY